MWLCITTTFLNFYHNHIILRSGNRKADRPRALPVLLVLDARPRQRRRQQCHADPLPLPEVRDVKARCRVVPPARGPSSSSPSYYAAFFRPQREAARRRSAVLFLLHLHEARYRRELLERTLREERRGEGRERHPPPRRAAAPRDPPRPGIRARAAPRDPCSRRAPKPVLAPRPGTRARGAPMVPPQGPAARTRSTGAEERAHRAPQIREIDARPEHAQDHPTRCGTRGTPVRGPGRENTAGDRHAPPSRASWERVHASPWGEPGTQDHEQGGRVSAPLRATRNRTGSQRRPQRQKRSTTNARWEMLLPSVRPLEFTESGPSLCSSRKPTRARVVRSAESNNHVPAGPAEPVEPCQSSAKRHQAQLTDVFARKHHKDRPARTST